MRPQCKGPLHESGLPEGYSETTCASMDNCRSDLLYQGRNCYSSLHDGSAPLGAPGHPCVHNVRALCRNLGCKEATAKADVLPWTTVMCGSCVHVDKSYGFVIPWRGGMANCGCSVSARASRRMCASFVLFRGLVN